MIYPYECVACSHRFDVCKPYSDKENPESCEECGSQETRRYLVPVRLGDISVEDAHWNPALGEVVRSTGHARRLAKERGMVEIGNEPLESIYKHTELEREKRIAKSWDDVDESLRTVTRAKQ